jgi:hypothetical protein
VSLKHDNSCYIYELIQQYPGAEEHKGSDGCHYRGILLSILRHRLGGLMLTLAPEL